MIQSFVLPVNPVGKGRPRVTIRGGHAHAFTPEKTANAETLIRWYLVEQRAVRIARGIPVRVTLTFYFTRPKSHPKRNPPRYPTTRPELDNCIKTVLDAAIGHVYDDDSQVVEIQAGQYYKAEGGPEIHFRVEEMAT